MLEGRGGTGCSEGDLPTQDVSGVAGTVHTGTVLNDCKPSQNPKVIGRQGLSDSP